MMKGIQSPLALNELSGGVNSDFTNGRAGVTSMPDTYTHVPPATQPVATEKLEQIHSAV